MAVSDYLLEIKGPLVKGESMDKQYKDAIEIDSWRWSGQNASTHQFGSGGGAGKVKLGDLQVSKRIVDGATVRLFGLLVRGTHIDQVILHCRKKGGGKEGQEQVEYLTITMRSCTISGLSLGGDPTAVGASESATIAYRRIEFVHILQKEDGTKGGGVAESWDLAENAR
jgi:type VI secretion system secreted protein Hcp